MTRALRHIPGGALLGEAIRKPMARRPRRVRVHDFDGDMVMTLDLSEHMQSHSFWHGYYSRDIVYLLKRILAPGMYFVDCGANVGELSLVAAKRVGPSGRVIAFEPLDRFAVQLEDNLRANSLTWAEVRRHGLSNQSGTGIIYLAAEAFGDGTHHDGLGTLFPSTDRGVAVDEIVLSTLDDLLTEGDRPIRVVKLDIEGAELAALQGADRLLSTQAPSLIVEIAEINCRNAGYAMRDIFDLLARYGYHFFRIERKGRLVSMTAADLGEFQNVYCTTNPRLAVGAG